MKKDTDSIGNRRIEYYAVTAVILLTLCSGCIESQNEVIEKSLEEPWIVGTVVEQNAIVKPSTTFAATQTTLTDNYPADYNDDNSPADYSKVSVSIDACADDDYMNAMVAGYATNNGENMFESVPIVTQLLNSEGQVVAGGEKSTTLTNLKAGETQKFSVIYEKPPQWKKCKASVNGDWNIDSDGGN